MPRNFEGAFRAVLAAGAEEQSHCPMYLTCLKQPFEQDPFRKIGLYIWACLVDTGKIRV